MDLNTCSLPIDDCCQILQEQPNEDLTKNQHHASNSIPQNINKFDQMIDKILDISSQ